MEEQNEGGPELGILEENAAVELTQIYDPEERRVLTLLGVELLVSGKQDLSFLESASPRHFGHGLILALERLGGTPRVLELPASFPFARPLGESVVPHQLILELSHAWDFGFNFAPYYEPGRPHPLEESFDLVIRYFLPGRETEELEDRNLALGDWLRKVLRNQKEWIGGKS